MNNKDEIEEQIAAFIAGVDLSIRIPEQSELVEGNDAIRYNEACDYPENADYVLAVEDLRFKNTKIEGQVIMEVGPGPGNLSEELSKAGAGFVFGIDPSMQMMEYLDGKFAKEIDENIMRFSPISVYSIPNEFKELFDVVVCQNTFHQLHNPKTALEEMVKVTKSGGQIHIWDFRRDISEELLAARISYTKPAIWRDLANSVCASLTKDEFRGILSEIDGIKFSVANAIDPSRLSERARLIIEQDPVPHHLDYKISQKVEIHKR